MHPKFLPLVAAFESLENAIDAATSERRSIMEISPAWNVSILDKTDLSFMAGSMASLVKERAPDEFGENDQKLLDIYIPRINALQATTVPYLFNGHGAQSVPALMTSLQGTRAWMESVWPLQEKIEPNTLPFKIARQARAARARLDDAVINIDEIKHQIAIIADAHQAAELLPADLEDLRAARARLGAANEQANTDGREIAKKLEEVSLILETIKSSSVEADGYAKKSSEAYRFTTSHGLAAAFDNRAKSLSTSMWVWVGGLLVALVGVALIGQARVVALTAIVSTADPRWGVVAINLVLSVLSVGAPLWLAWVATKQIGQRFRLSEDYGFKASVAKAYEGYRREAINIDKSFEAQLFSIALDRLQEAPLRLVEKDSYGSPWHEFFESPVFNEAKKNVPDLAHRITEYVKKISGSNKTVETSEKKTSN